MKGRIFAVCAVLIIAMMIPAAAIEQVHGPDAGLFSMPTSVPPVTVVVGPLTAADNLDRSKDSAVMPPPFGGGGVLTGGMSESGLIQAFDPFTSTPVVASAYTPPDGLLEADGRLGTLSIPRIQLTAPVYQGENLSNLKIGVGHFESTSSWDGNVGFAAHNRGTTNHFGQIHLLENGDIIRYTTRLGTRTYEVFSVETDFTRLGYTGENIVTLITCVRDIPELRWCVQAIEVV